MKIVGIGASAGGLAAMSSLLAHLPDNTGACFVFLQHLSPNSKSIMGELLAKHTNMPVEVVYENQPVQANHVYVMAESKNLEFAHGMLLTKDRQPSETINLPIDQFFHSLGENQGSEVISVLLSGTGTDGTRGLRTIKEQGGIVLVQSPESAEFDGMPRAAIDLKIADSVEPTEKLADIIVDLLQGLDGTEHRTSLKDDKSKPHFNRIIKLMSAKTGVDFTGYRTPTLLRRMNNRLLINKCNDMAEYLALLEQNPGEMKVLCHDVLIGVTRFFRDPEAFENIRKTVLPKIFSQEHPAEKPYRFWIPACSTGEEAYSIAMLVDQYIQENGLDVDYKIFASDIDQGAIRFAIKGLYSSSMVADTPKDLTANYFIKEGDEYRVRPFLRKRILFAVQNLLGDPPFIDMDLISCRNFMIYLKPETQQKLLSTLHFALRENGVLFLGPSESLGGLKYAFTKVTQRWNLFEKHADAQLKYRRSDFKVKDTDRGIDIEPNIKKNNFKMTYDEHDTDPFTQYLVEQYAPISLFVNKDLDLLYINGDAERLLSMPRALARLNLRKMLDPAELSKIQTGVEQVLEEQQPKTYSNISLSKGEKTFTASLRFDLPSIPRLQKEEEEIILIEIHLSNQGVQNGEDLGESDFSEAKEASMQRSLQEAKRRSKELVNELESTNEELQTSNRELMASNEELQSTNEELQSVNEELYTVNSELQLKNKELTTAHNDINNLLKSTEIGTIFLDKELQIRKFTPAVKRQFRLLESDIGRTITSFSTTFKSLDIKKECQKVFDTLETFEREVIDDSGDHYLTRILPYRTEEDNIDGLVITFIDINDLVNTQRRMDRLAKKFKAIFNFSYSVIAVMSTEGDIESLNRSFGPYQPEDLIGNNIFEVIPDYIVNDLRQSLRKAVKEEEPQKLEVELAKGDWYDVSLIPNPYQEKVAEKESLTVILMAEEVTNDKQRAIKLESSLEKYKAFMDNAKQQIAIVDEKGAINYLNHASYTGKPKSELQGDSIYKYLPEENREEAKRIIAKVFNGSPMQHIQFSFDYEGGKRGEADLIFTPVIIAGRIEYVAIVQNKRS